MIKENEIIFLLGAGASADMGIPTLKQMDEEIIKLLDTDESWKKFKDLYYLIRASYEYSYGIQSKQAHFNLEVLLNILQELRKKEEHPLYPFIGSWNVKFDEVVKNNFKIIDDFDKQIRKKLYEWVKIDNEKRKKLSYLSSFTKLRKEGGFDFPLHIFTLNYDLGIEKANENSRIERGFDKTENGGDGFWNFRRFMELNSEEQPDIYLYKLHGSIDWERDSSTQKITYCEGESNNPVLIFGTQYKMQYVDPFLFLFSEFRRKVFESKLIISVGYSFYDEHINGVLSDSLRLNKNQKIISVAKDLLKVDICKRLHAELSNNVVTKENANNAKDFFEKILNKTFIFEHTDAGNKKNSI